MAPEPDTAMVSAAEVDKAPSSMAGRKNVRYRLSKSYIKGIIALRPEPPETMDDLESIADLFPPEWIEEKRRSHEETKEFYREMDEEFAEFRQKVIDGVKEKGYFEVDEDYVADLEESEDYFTFSDKDDTRLLHVPEEDDYLLSDGDDDEDVEGVDGAVLGQQTAHESN